MLEDLPPRVLPDSYSVFYGTSAGVLPIVRFPSSNTFSGERLSEFAICLYENDVGMLEPFTASITPDDRTLYDAFVRLRGRFGMDNEKFISWRIPVGYDLDSVS